MGDPQEITALKASLRGALGAADALAALRARIEAMEPGGDLPASELEELARVSSAHAMASAALRGLVHTMLARRGLSGR